MIDVDRISKSFGNNDAIKNVSITVDKEELLVILGPSGCGKTTLLRLIAGFEKPDSGIIKLNGKRASYSGKIAIPPSRRKLSMIFQDLALWPHMSVLEHIKFTMGNFLKMPQDVINVLKQVHMNDKLNRFPHELSGGEKQRLAIARAIAPRPYYLLMDEPFSNLDVLLKQEMMDLTLKLKKDYRMAIIYVTHDLEEALYLANRTIIMRDGKIVWSDSKEKLSKQLTVEDLKNIFRQER